MFFPKLYEGYHVEVFLRSFENLENSYGWEKSRWAIRLVPHLSGKALEAYPRMAVNASNDYDLVKQAIQERYDINALAYGMNSGMASRIDHTLIKNMPCVWKTISNIGFRQTSPEAIMLNSMTSCYVNNKYS